MASRKSCEGKPALRRQRSKTEENIQTPIQRKRHGGMCPPLGDITVNLINISAENGGTVSTPFVSGNNIDGGISNSTVSSQKTLQDCVQQRIPFRIRRSSTRSNISDSHALTKLEPESPRRVLVSEFDASNESKENYVTVEKAKNAFEHEKVTLKGQIVHTGSSPLKHQYKLRDTTGDISFSTDKKLEVGWYSLTGVVVQAQKVLIVTPDTVITPIAPLEDMRPLCVKVVRGTIITAKLSVRYFCIRAECKTELPGPLNNKDHVTCQKCRHSVVYSQMPRFAAADITLKTDKESESVFVLSHTLLCSLVPLGVRGVIDTKGVERQLLGKKICLSVKGKEVTEVR